MNSNEFLDSVFETKKEIVKEVQDIQTDKFVTDKLLAKQNAVKNEVISPEAVVIPKVDLYNQKKKIESIAFDELQNILADPDAKDSDKVKAIGLVLKPHYPTTRLEVRAQVDNMSGEQLLEYIKQIKK